MSESHRSLFAKLVEPYFDGLYRTAMRLTRNADDAEDLVQEACLRAYAQLSSLERAERPAAWLQRVQYRIFIDDVRHRRRSPFAALSEPGNLLDITPSQQPNPEELADGALLERHLEHAWRLLGKEQRALLALHAEGYSLSDLELITGAGRNAIGVRLHRARTKLARLLEARLERPAPCAKMEVER